MNKNFLIIMRIIFFISYSYLLQSIDENKPYILYIPSLLLNENKIYAVILLQSIDENKPYILYIPSLLLNENKIYTVILLYTIIILLRNCIIVYILNKQKKINILNQHLFYWINKILLICIYNLINDILFMCQIILVIFFATIFICLSNTNIYFLNKNITIILIIFSYIQIISEIAIIIRLIVYLIQIIVLVIIIFIINNILTCINRPHRIKLVDLLTKLEHYNLIIEYGKNIIV